MRLFLAKFHEFWSSKGTLQVFVQEKSPLPEEIVAIKRLRRFLPSRDHKPQCLIYIFMEERSIGHLIVY